MPVGAHRAARLSSPQHASRPARLDYLMTEIGTTMSLSYNLVSLRELTNHLGEMKPFFGIASHSESDRSIVIVAMTRLFNVNR